MSTKTSRPASPRQSRIVSRRAAPLAELGAEARISCG